MCLVSMSQKCREFLILHGKSSMEKRLNQLLLPTRGTGGENRLVSDSIVSDSIVFEAFS